MGNGDAAQCGLIEPLPGLEFGKVVDESEAEPGDELTYTVTVENIGEAEATDLVVTDTLPENTTYVSSSPEGIHDNGVVTWDIATLEPGDVVELTVTVTVDEGTENSTLVNTVHVTNPPGSPPPVVDNPCEDDPTRSCAETVVPKVPGEPGKPTPPPGEKPEPPPAKPGEPGQPGKPLPVTGPEGWLPLVAIAGALLSLGAAFLIGSRRRGQV